MRTDKQLFGCLIFLLLAMLNACGSSEKDVDFIMVSPIIKDMDATGGTFDISVSANGSWSQSADRNWIEISPRYGEGNTSVTITVSENMGIQSDNGTVTFISGSASAVLTINRKGASPAISIQPMEVQTVEAVGGSIRVDVLSNTSWSVSSGQTWAKPSVKNGDGNGMVTIEIEPNTSTEADMVEVVFIAGGIHQTLIINRKGIVPTLQITPSDIQIVEASGGSVSVQVSSNWHWSVSSSKDWAKLAMKEGDGDANVAIAIEPAITSIEEDAIITFSSGEVVKKMTIRRKGVPHTLSISPTGYVSLPAVNSTFEIQVFSDTEWNVRSEDPTWMTVCTSAGGTPAADAKGTGNGIVTVHVMVNETGQQKNACVFFEASGLKAQLAVWQERAQLPDFGDEEW